MAEPTRTCSRCQRVVRESAFVLNGDVCPVCAAGDERRPDPTPGKWAPTNVGTLSLFIDPMLITSIVAVSRARAWLAWAGEREQMGEYSPWHAYVRSNAIWALVLAGVQPILALVLLSWASFMTIEVPATQMAIPTHDEHAEIMSLVSSEHADLRLIGVCQLSEITAVDEDRRLVMSAMQADDAMTGACGHMVLAQLDGTSLEQRYVGLSFDVRAALRDIVAERDEALAERLAILEETIQ